MPKTRSYKLYARGRGDVPRRTKYRQLRRLSQNDSQLKNAIPDPGNIDQPPTTIGCCVNITSEAILDCGSILESPASLECSENVMCEA
ncbi:Hypothetical predicted protein, partial [Olea europaea subsp. europaea]